MNNIWLALAMTAIAGLSTGIGSLMALIAKDTNKKFLSISLGFSAGVMIYVSMREIFTKSVEALSSFYGSKIGNMAAIASFFAGMLIIALIDKFIPKEQSPQGILICETDCDNCEHSRKRLLRTGIFTALAIGIHNFPEGLITFISALHDPTMAIPVVAAVAIHNIPEGIAVSVPIYYATKSKKKAFAYSFLSGLAEPVGAIVGYLILMPFMNEMVFGVLFGIVAGIMVFISFDELLPAAREYAEHKHSLYGLVSGMALMSISLWLFL